MVKIHNLKKRVVSLFRKETTGTLLKYSQDIEWSLPGLFSFDASWGMVYNVLFSAKIDIPKINFYGTPRCVWSGGRASATRHILQEKHIRNTFSYAKINGAIPTLTFTRHNIDEKKLKDEYANLILNIALEEKARFIVSSDLLKDYIKSKDSNCIVVSSILQPIFKFQQPFNLGKVTFEEETHYYNELLEKYDVVVVRPEYSLKLNKTNYKLISDISRIEVLINQFCPQNCPKAVVHYTHLEDDELNEQSEDNFTCYTSSLSIQELINRTTIHTKEKIEELLGFGVKHLKVHGRAPLLNPVAQPLISLREIYKSDSQITRLLFQSFANNILYKKELEYFVEYVEK